VFGEKRYGFIKIDELNGIMERGNVDRITQTWILGQLSKKNHDMSKWSDVDLNLLYGIVEDFYTIVDWIVVAGEQKVKRDAKRDAVILENEEYVENSLCRDFDFMMNLWSLLIINDEFELEENERKIRERREWLKKDLLTRVASRDASYLESVARDPEKSAVFVEVLESTLFIYQMFTGLVITENMMCLAIEDMQGKAKSLEELNAELNVMLNDDE
jgi:hypothetical protein